jgi:hypothetical protein
MKNYLREAIEWLAQRMIVAAIPRAMEIIDEAGGKESNPKALAAPRLPEIETH